MVQLLITANPTVMAIANVVTTMAAAGADRVTTAPVAAEIRPTAIAALATECAVGSAIRSPSPDVAFSIADHARRFFPTPGLARDGIPGVRLRQPPLLRAGRARAGRVDHPSSPHRQAPARSAHRPRPPHTRSYTGYVPLHRPYVVRNVFAAPRFSVQAVPQCFPIAGCVAYRGWFSEAAAKADAARLRAAGDDVWIGGVPAYSTLGWFADPILSSMLRWDDDELAGTIFHELAHQLIYVKSDTTFNESFATFVQEQGLRAWRASRDLPPEDAHQQAMADGFTSLVLDLRERLKTLYASGVDQVAMAAGKQREIAAFRTRYAHWRQQHWPGDHRYDAWVAQPINNAQLLPFGLYDQWTPAFAALFRRARPCVRPRAGDGPAGRRDRRAARFPVARLNAMQPAR